MTEVYILAQNVLKPVLGCSGVEFYLIRAHWSKFHIVIKLKIDSSERNRFSHPPPLKDIVKKTATEKHRPRNGDSEHLNI